MAGSNSIQELCRQLGNVIKQHPFPHSAALSSQGPLAGGSPQRCGQHSCRASAPTREDQGGAPWLASLSVQGGPQGEDTLDPSFSARTSPLLGSCSRGCRWRAPAWGTRVRKSLGKGPVVAAAVTAPVLLRCPADATRAEGHGGLPRGCAERRPPTHRLPGRCPRRLTGAVEEAREDGERRARAGRMCCLTLRG